VAGVMFHTSFDLFYEISLSRCRTTAFAQERNQDFAKGRGLKIENFCDVILMTYFV